VVIDRETIIEPEHIEEILESGTKTILLHKEEQNLADYAIIYNTLQKDPCNSEKEAVLHIYRQLRNSEPPDEATARDVIDKLFFSDKRYDLGDVGRYRLNKKLGLNTDGDTKVLTKEDIIEIIKYLIKLLNARTDVDDIDHLSNRRVRTVGEQLYTQFGVGLARMARTIRERMNVRDNEVFTPIDLINSKTLSSVINSFFGTNALSQFMDQTNPLAEITHKRRMSALGPGGLSRERAGFEVRDVHYTHYGRLCPIETPEGPNIGLISSLCVFAKINNLGFIETPYRKVVDGKVDLSSDGVGYLSAEEEEGLTIAQANAPLNEDGTFVNPKAKSRKDGDFPFEEIDNIDLMDVAPNQIASIAASLIPFLEHDDANRALMGSNMMRQAVPVIKPESPIVGTGLEGDLVRDSRTQIAAHGEGVIEFVDANKIVVKYARSEEESFVSFEGDTRTYNLPKYGKTNQGTTIDLKPIVTKGQKVVEGQIMTHGYATQDGELALGRNLKVAFMPWKGYNYEDAIVISERIVKDDVFTSVHVDEYTLEVRDTKRGMEELTSDIPNVSEDATRNLDENGLIRIGANVEPGDILIGKITPKGESDPSPEEKLLRAIFGDKAGDVKDASLKASPSLRGVVIDKKLFERAVKDKSKRARDKVSIANLDDKYVSKFEDLRSKLTEKLFSFISGKTSQGVYNDLDEEVLQKGKKFTLKMLNAVPDFALLTKGTWTTDDHINRLVSELIHNYKIKVNDLQGALRREKFTISVGDELPAGILKLAKIYIAKKRKLKVGDKMAGRHGNKGVISTVIPVEDMPYDENGTPVDIVLNPLGVPSRMNVGQIMEIHLGMAAKGLGDKIDRMLREQREVLKLRELLAEIYNAGDGRIEDLDSYSDAEILELANNLRGGVPMATPAFDGAKESEIKRMLELAGIPESGQVTLYDGRTGEAFDRQVTVGYMYMLKLNHLVDDKMHARSTGSYSLVTQQPLGGKAQFGGQRFGEMEVWALEAYGAAYTLQEMLTVKSDDVNGRTKMYKNIVDGDHRMEPGMPESFNVLLKEIRSLGINIELEEN
jgi:DNA-directed RNA polymerase subunit beta